ncbi:2-succinyl-6-hydroxy-2, 4-cyclohexadiene-1-carboxylate synthase [Brucella sp. NBRC 12952]|uniref:Acetoin dehydrogenase dihydrolipoyllysine-residue acetyltransferase subunit n=1 Tax=Brucella pseudogrignonensis TaxID=419475 RepID=A0A7Y3T3E3_9HYPH|nr:acetoin dehydrogenase dihydrolipoyllysine-residue acetyltransferase subunit [Brucella pseudogrignonensis]EMG52190.1 acetoin dehydrogenase E2 subunit dihydrolipoyllysine-residue acetyltransferase [Ochrobactrum sp. CDB2]NNV19996.1 acetoin dehydrogenase dihydrolipoyllysine-residue acetyltransferase subunit [Brucella pseudogrignonensis]
MTERILKMPRLGETMEEGKIVGFLVNPGDSFKRGDSIIEIETDKTVAEFPALGDGTLHEWIGSVGDHVVVGAPLARIDIGVGPDWTDEGGESTPVSEESTDDFVVTELDMPRLGETMEEGRIVRWLKAAGDSFERGEAVLEIETDKTVAEFPALVGGKIVEILRQKGDMVTVGGAIARIEVAAGAATLKPDAPAVETVAASAVPIVSSAAVARQAGRDKRVRATPLARRIARDKGIDIQLLSGTGRRGRIEKEDVLAASGNTLPKGDIQFVELGRGRVAYSDQGSKDAPTFLLLHGFSGDRTTWSGIASGLRRANFRVIAPDLPAHGLTTIEAGHIDQLSDFLSEFLDALSVKNVHVVAHSLGALAATEFAQTHAQRVSGLTLIAPAGLGSEIDASFISGMANATTAGEVTHLLRRVAAKPVELSPELAADFARTMSKGRLKALAETIIGSSGQRIDIITSLDKLLRSMSVRVLVGLQDRIIPWQQVTSLPPSASVHFFAQSGHMPQWDQTKDVLDLILSSTGEADD